MTNDDNEPTVPADPILSFSLEHGTDGGDRVVLRYLDPASMEVTAEVWFENPDRLVAAAETAMASARVLATAHLHGFGVALEAHGPSVAIEPPDLTDVDLTVEDILDAGPEGR